MKILGLDSSGLVASVAVAEDDVLLAESTLDYKKTHSQTLLPMLDELRHKLDLDLNTLDAIAVAAGPGSFTGLRIGAATAKGLGLALGKPLVAVPTLEGLAWNLWGADRLVCPLMDARRNQVYAAAYAYVAEEGGVFSLQAMIPQMPLDITELLAKLNELDRSVFFLGDGVAVYRGEIEKLCKVSYAFAPAGSNRQKASSIAALGAVYYRAGRAISAEAFRPEYLRKSQAEREAEQAETDRKDGD